MKPFSRIAVAVALITSCGWRIPAAIAQQPTPAPPTPGILGTIDGDPVTEQEFLGLLEQQTVEVPGGQPTNALRVVLESLVSNRVMMAEAARNGVLPSDADVDRMYAVQKSLIEQQIPGTIYEDLLKEQGATVEEIKASQRVQLAETAIYAKLLKIDKNQVDAAYAKYRSHYGLPARVQLRMIVVQDGSPDFAAVRQNFAAKRSFEEIATRFNPPSLRRAAGLVQQIMAMDKIPEPLRSQISKRVDEAIFGPTDLQKGQKAWIKIEKKFPEYVIPAEDAAPLVLKDLVTLKMNDPANEGIRRDLQQKKLTAMVELTGRLNTIWEGIKRRAVAAGIGQPANP